MHVSECCVSVCVCFWVGGEGAWEWGECVSCFGDYDIPSVARGPHWMKACREFDVFIGSGDFLFLSQCFKNILFDVWIESGDFHFLSQCFKNISFDVWGL